MRHDSFDRFFWLIGLMIVVVWITALTIGIYAALKYL